MPLNTFFCFSRMHCRIVFGVEAMFLCSQMAMSARGVRILDTKFGHVLNIRRVRWFFDGMENDLERLIIPIDE